MTELTLTESIIKEFIEIIQTKTGNIFTEMQADMVISILEQYPKLKAENEELKRKYDLVLKGQTEEVVRLSNQAHKLQQENNQLKQIKQKIDQQGIENIVEDLLYDMNHNFNNGVLNVDEIRIQFNRYLQQLLKDDTTA